MPKGKLAVFLEAVFLPLKINLRLISKKSTAENCTDFTFERKIPQKDALRIKEILKIPAVNSGKKINLQFELFSFEHKLRFRIFKFFSGCFTFFRNPQELSKCFSKPFSVKFARLILLLHDKCYNLRMSKNILIAGKDFPDSQEFVKKFELSDFNIVVSGETPEEDSGQGFSIAPWNRDSAISARYLILQAETINGFCENYILYFDSTYFAIKYSSCSTDICARACDAMILGFQYLALEILNRIEQHKSQAKLIFLLKSNPTANEILRSSSLRKSGAISVNPIVSAAEAAFATFAENLAAKEIDNEYARILLISGDRSNDISANDSALASWLKDYINACDELKKGVPPSTNWIKAGAKAPTEFSLFR